MRISPELMLAILAMDSYNRGYNQGISGLGGTGTSIGTAVLGTSSNTAERSDAVTASFFAQAYTLASGETVISYRGTDQPGLDFENGFGIGQGIPLSPQGMMAIDFYRSAIGQGDRRWRSLGSRLRVRITYLLARLRQDRSYCAAGRDEDARG